MRKKNASGGQESTETTRIPQQKNDDLKRLTVGIRMGQDAAGDAILDLVQRVIKYLEGTASEKSEFEGIRNSDITDQDRPAFDLLIGTPRPLRIFADSNNRTSRPVVSSIPTIVLIPRDHEEWDADLTGVLQSSVFDVRCVCRVRRLLTGPGNEWPDPEEFGMFVEVFKVLWRNKLRCLEIGEERMVKDIHWKARVSEDNLSPGYTSLFADPGTQSMSRSVKDAISQMREKARLFDTASELFDPHGNCFERYETAIRERKKGSATAAVRGARIPSILLLGQTGTGKTLLARWIAREILGDEAFHRVNISTFNKELIDGELFGVTKGSYTGADSEKLGEFLKNRGRVVFLDEIGDMDPRCQVRLLTYLDEGMVRPLGWSGDPIPAPCVVVAATNKPVDRLAETDDAAFRRDLFHRFDHVVRIPSLSERRKDMRLLISLTLQEDEVNPQRAVKRISLDAVYALEQRDYPGNFRELRNVLRMACARAFRERSVCLCLRHLL